MRQFEYKEQHIEKKDYINCLNYQGQEGWELVAIKYTGRNYLCFFKREIEESAYPLGSDLTNS